MNAMRPPEVEAVIAFARIALKAFSERVLTLLAMIGGFVLFGYVLLYPDWIRAATAAAYAVLVLWPIVRLEAAKKETQ